MQAKISAGNDCLRFPQVTGGNFPAPAGKLGEAFIVPVRSAFFQGERRKARFLLSSSKHFDQSNHLLLLKSMVNPSNLILFQKSWNVPCWLFKPLNKKAARWKSHHYHQNDRELAIVTFLVFSLIPSEGEITSKSRSWSWIALELQCIFDGHYCFFYKNILISKTKNALLFVGEKFLNFSKNRFPRERLNK